MSENTAKTPKEAFKPIKKNEIKENLIKLCQETSMHGLGNIVNNEIFLFKLGWFIIVLIGIAATTYC